MGEIEVRTPTSVPQTPQMSTDNQHFLIARHPGLGQGSLALCNWCLENSPFSKISSSLMVGMGTFLIVKSRGYESQPLSFRIRHDPHPLWRHDRRDGLLVVTRQSVALQRCNAAAICSDDDEGRGLGSGRSRGVGAALPEE